MDLIYMNPLYQDVGVLIEPELDLAFGKDENDFACRVHISNHCCEKGYFIYAEGTEYGGIVDNIEVDTASDSVTYSGRSWQGMLASRIILPLQSGETSTASVTLETTTASGDSLVNRHLIISGDANACLAYLLDRIGLPSALFRASEEAAGVAVSGYQFRRYTDAYEGLCDMLASAGLRLQITHVDGLVTLSAAGKYDYSQDEEFESELVDFTSKTHYNKVNHLICLGTGEMENRLVVHLYADADGKVSQTQTFFGIDEYVDTYSDTSVETMDDLIANGTEQLLELQTSDEITVDFDYDSDSYFVGDIVGSYDSKTGISVSAEITKKIVTIKNGMVNISYQVG